MLNRRQKLQLNDVCVQLYHSLRLNSKHRYAHKLILRDLTSYVCDSYADAELQLYGSSENGFGTKNSDLDFCLTFEDDQDCPRDTQITVLKTLEDDLEGNIVNNVAAITNCKVPILKFSFILNFPISRNFDCDLSLYNNLALRNTKLLKTYSEIDRRVPMLGILVKHFFKKFGLSEASKGGLSSYAYTLMTIYYLQQCDPPVLPVLQEIEDGSRPYYYVDNWNTYFFDNLNELEQRWYHYDQNNESIAELLVGFFHFYCNEFCFDRTVICIRKLRPLVKHGRTRRWLTPISIQDPFLLSHNLGIGVDFEGAGRIFDAISDGFDRCRENNISYESLFEP